MASATLYPPPRRPHPAAPNPLPQLVHTPSGLALLELQGSINLPADDGAAAVRVGTIEFPDCDPAAAAAAAAGSAWTKRVHMHVGRYQRLAGEVKKLPRAVAVVRRRRREAGGVLDSSPGARVGQAADDLEVVEIIKYKIVFSSRPEPVGSSSAS
ncbi:uncharacterized protein UV8b_05335 [Ustilaginoidea virens]|uniref:Sister chromatid cohesion protein Ctf8 n=1 Tax=Ustilaginoidea virens TaxID=1159556 RepID=A0A8E5MIJ6_USTVR|nr:uncharacterized protein UV8b_05335 [Ustilaginoidea virens]QUC21092.1 hypothetical protein UV8b_05335 [Ustilaginoidea virens]